MWKSAHFQQVFRPFENPPLPVETTAYLHAYTPEDSGYGDVTSMVVQTVFSGYFFEIVANVGKSVRQKYDGPTQMP